MVVVTPRFEAVRRAPFVPKETLAPRLERLTRSPGAILIDFLKIRLIDLFFILPAEIGDIFDYFPHTANHGTGKFFISDIRVV